MPNMNERTAQHIGIGRWIRATFRGWVLGVALIVLLSSALDAVGIGHLQFYIGVAMGAAVGLTQWLLLRKYKAVSGAWLWFSLAGMSVPFLIVDLLLPATVSWKLALSVVLGGADAGFLQFLILKRYARKAWIWGPGACAGWTLAALTVLLINYTMTIKAAGSVNLVLALLNLLLILAGGIILGVVTGNVLKKIEWVDEEQAKNAGENPF